MKFLTNKPLGSSLALIRQSKGQAGQLIRFLGPMAVGMGILFLSIERFVLHKRWSEAWFGLIITLMGIALLLEARKTRKHSLAIHELGVECKSIQHESRFRYEEVAAWQCTRTRNEVATTDALLRLADVGDIVTVRFHLRGNSATAKSPVIEWCTTTNRQGEKVAGLETLKARLDQFNVPLISG